MRKTKACKKTGARTSRSAALSLSSPSSSWMLSADNKSSAKAACMSADNICAVIDFRLTSPPFFAGLDAFFMPGFGEGREGSCVGTSPSASAAADA